MYKVSLVSIFFMYSAFAYGNDTPNELTGLVQTTGSKLGCLNKAQKTILVGAVVGGVVASVAYLGCTVVPPYYCTVSFPFPVAPGSGALSGLYNVLFNCLLFQASGVGLGALGGYGIARCRYS